MIHRLLDSKLDLTDNHAGERVAECCSLANACLELSRQGGFTDKKLLKKATYYFITALQYQSDCIPAYLGLACLLSLTEQHTQALQVLKEGLGFHPGEPQLMAFMKAIRQQMREAPPAVGPEDEFPRLSPLAARHLKASGEKTPKTRKTAKLMPIELDSFNILDFEDK